MSVDSRFAAPALASLKDCALDDPRLPTPLFVIDSQKLEKNLRRAQDRAAKLGVAFRPHLKTHKSIGIALRQMTTPQGPATVSTLAEARYFGARGVTDLIYAVGIAPQKLAEVSRLRSLGADINSRQCRSRARRFGILQQGKNDDSRALGDRCRWSPLRYSS